MMLILKIPIVYLGLVVWYAIKAEPEPGKGPQDYDQSIWRPWRKRGGGPRPRRGGPHGTRTARATARGGRGRVRA